MAQNEGVYVFPDAEEGYIFNRFFADTVFMNNPIDWEEVF